MHKKRGALIAGGLVLGALLAAACAKLGPLDFGGTEASPSSAAVKTEAPLPAKPEGSDPATILAYKTGVDRAKVEQILSIYRTSAREEDSGRDIYKIALFAGEKTGLPTAQVGSVILSYKALVGTSSTASAPSQKG
jgi:hypothetical protein